MRVRWKNCPKSWKQQYYNPRDGKHAAIVMEAMYHTNLYYWHVFVGRPGTNNDISVAQNSPLFTRILNGKRTMKLPEGYVLHRITQNRHLYYLVDGKYPAWAIFVKPIHAPINIQQQTMTAMQKGKSKDIERLFGALQGHFRILTSSFLI